MRKHSRFAALYFLFQDALVLSCAPPDLEVMFTRSGGVLEMGVDGLDGRVGRIDV